jgi:hypothetical protein
MLLPQPRDGEPQGFHSYPSFGLETTLGEPETIVWSSIRHLCSQAAAAYTAGAHGHTHKRVRETIARSVKLYVGQSYEFYEVATNAKPNTAPLLYYYAFLNLAKALCEFKKPKLHERTECYSHGIGWRPNPKMVVRFQIEYVTVRQNGMWQALWAALMKVACPVPPNTRMHIQTLFSYCPDIGVEYRQSCGLDRLNSIALESPNVMYNKQTQEAWLSFSIERWLFRAARISAPKFLRQISVMGNAYTEVLSADPKELRRFQSTSVKPAPNVDDIHEAFADEIRAFSVVSHMGPEQRLRYLVPIQRTVQYRIPQILTSYSILFWLGSLVRYDPHSVRSLMDSHYWILIDGFMSQCRPWLLEQFRWALYNEETTLTTTR